MRKDYPYALDKRTKRLTVVFTTVLALAVVFFSLYSISGYFSAWFITFVIIALTLVILSIPRKVSVNDDDFEISCIVEFTAIPLEDVASIRPMAPGEMKYVFPVLGIYGFFGYFGYYFSLSEWSVFRIYASEWNHFVRVETIYKNVYIVNCGDPDELVHRVETARQHKLSAR